MKSRSILADNTIEFRHPLMFTALEVAEHYEDFSGNLEQYKGTERDAFWILRKGSRSVGTGDRLYQLVQENVRDFEAVMEQLKDDPSNPALRLAEEERLTGQRADLVARTVRWFGRYFTFPDGFTVQDYTGSGDATEAATSYELAGQLMPCDPKLLALLDGDLVDAASMEVVKSQNRRSPAEEKEFPESAVPAQPPRKTPGRGRTRGEK